MTKRICDWAQSDEGGGLIEYHPCYGTCSFNQDLVSEYNQLGVAYHTSNKKVPKPWFTGKRKGLVGVELGEAFDTFEEAMEHMKKLGYTFKHWRAMLPAYKSTKAIKDFDSRCTVE